MLKIRTIVEKDESLPCSDIIEWRADLSENSTLEDIRRTVGSKPLLFTNRGGDCRDAIVSGIPDYVDFDIGEDRLEDMISLAKSYGIRVIVSHHDFSRCPKNIRSILNGLKNTGADVVKLAVTPQNNEDVKRLRAESLKWKRQNDTLLMIIGMGAVGAETREKPESFGSDMIFDMPPRR